VVKHNGLNSIDRVGVNNS